ncbi:fibronectin isoform X5 [Ctenopharyngodon idella]|uniref:fibronectin isoform X4 n=1 Tax=Ctenopharyngodon idella TaxID=7959 RepID=UPI0022328F1F|nr:fibronectin isoform X4 [Ctenopharyngodon idella]XP_051768223.1 fibronectin isoform X5 [Ctenopharyngodon idella]
MATDVQQQRLGSCHTMGTSCQLTSLPCGMRLNVTVQADGASCNSSSQPKAAVVTAPCIPTHVTAALNCTSNIASITWYSALGATWYLVKAEGSQGYKTSCNNTVTRCDIPNLQCGQEYSITVMGVNGDCIGPASQPITLVSAPCPNTGIQAKLDCRTNSALISWTPGNGALSFNATLQSFQDAQKHSCFTNGSSCNITSLPCGQHYNVSVTGYGQNCSTCSKPLVTLDTAPCVSTQVNVSLSCGSDTASVSWAASSGLVSYYTVTAEGDNGITLTCNSSSTSCNISGLTCGQAYNVSVTAMSGNCTGQRSEVRRVSTAPCVPVLNDVALNCSSKSAVVNWSSSGSSLDVFSVSAVSAQGERLGCGIFNNRSCVVDGLQCGQTYTFSMNATQGQCTSASNTLQRETAPCPPLNIQSRMNCGNNTASVSWSRGNGALSYLTTLECSNGQTYMCRTNETGCDITNMTCGQTCSVKVVAEGRSCNSSVGTGSPIVTAPCPNTGIQAKLDCRTNSALISWTPGNGALSFNATLQSFQDAQKHSCFTNGSSCNITSLPCGQHYNVSVTGYGQNCSTCSKPLVTLDTAPCVSTQVNVSLSCGSDTASVSWAASSGLVSYYTVTAEGDKGITLTCNSSSTSCNISGLACGQAYNVSVTAMSGNCTGQRSEVRRVNTAPCVPQNVSANVSCSSNIATVTWGSSQGAELYSVTASSVNGLSANCTSASTSCDLLTLTCGESYTITVKAKGSNCSSGNSAPVQVQAVPCTPWNVLPTVNCLTNALVVSWTSSAGGQQYTATAQDSNGLSTTCQSTGSQCTVTGLKCGQLYHVNVMASDNLCSSPPSATVNTNSAPCTASSIKAVLDCQLGTATVSWQYGAGAQGYVVSALAPLGNRASCTSNSSITHCELGNLQCGNEYMVNVQTLGSMCNSSAQMNGSLITGPCAPQHLIVQYSPSTALLSWDVTKGAANFTAVAVTAEGLTVTCETSNTSCTLPGLGCGQIYNISVTARNSVCNFTATYDPIKTEPCPPQNVKASINCTTLNATVSWEPSQFAVGYIAFLEGQNGHSTSCRTDRTYCSVPDLNCGTVYYVRVRAIGEVFNSSDSTGVNMTSAPCLSTSVSAIVDCATDSALVSWSVMVGVENYTVMALGSGGQRFSCSSQQNHCNISSLQCGQLYNLTFTSTNQQCQITSATNVTFQSRPCVPLHAAVDNVCGNNTAVMSWEAREGVDYYTARALSAGGVHQEFCNSTSSTCSFSNLGCGETYTFTVTAYSGRCQSSASAPVYLTTDPCRPENVTAHMSCNSEMVALNWSNAKGVSFYTVTAKGSLGYTVDFNTSSTSLSVSLLCGQSYNVTVQGQNDRCDSPVSAPAVFRLAPCTPHNLVTYVECKNQVGSVSWGPSDGANMYTATAIGNDGHTHLCVTNGTSCTWEDLHCGEIYNVTVTANDSRCTSTRSNSTFIHMAPCVPQALTPILDCGTGLATLSWASSAGAETYAVEAVSGNGNVLSFSTNITSGFLSELLCGQQYQITVKASNKQCRSAQSSPANLSTAPCAPQNVLSELDCLSNILTVRWNISRGAAFYLVSAAGPEGPVNTCNTTAQQCKLQTLRCSSSYSVSVIAVNQQCKTSGGSILEINTVPCVPSHVQGRVNCTTGDVSVSWNQSVGAISYTVIAWSSGGYTSVCNSTGTACVFSDLLCGMNYSLAVSARDGTCSTAPSQPVVLNTVSCKSQNASALLNCDTNSAVVTWELTDNVTHHVVQAAGSDGHRINCTSSDHSCTLLGMHCGQRYNLTVTAMDGVCDNSNTYLTLQSAPCAPSNIQTSLLCDIHNGSVVSVSWVQANGAEAYRAVAVSNDGHSYSCNTTTASCNLQELQCGQIYNVSVYSLASGCGGVKSTMSQVQTAPCPPQNVSANMQCDSGSVQVSWSPTVDASQFRVEMQSQITGVISSCNSTNTQCSIAHLPCGESFNISVVALRGSCQSQPSSGLNIVSAPCTPQGVNGTVDCVTNSAWVSWDVDKGAESYTVLAVGDDGQNTTCSSPNSTCYVPDLGCGKSYTFQVTASNAACLSPPSNSFQLETAPCTLSSIVVVAECQSSVIIVQWQRAQKGKSLYIATAEDQDHVLNSCNSSASSCNLTNVQCGKEYTISVAASANQCSSLRSPPYKIRTAPCQPSQVQAYTDCQSKAVFVSWDPSYVAQSYLLTAVSRDGDLKTCNTSYNNCTLTDLHCSNTYNVTVLASNENCTSLPSTNVTFKTAPCKPANVTANIQCGNSSASLSWVGSTGAVAYVGIAQSENGTTLYCQNTAPSCTLVGLVCGTVYNFTVQATDGTCNSSLSEPQIGGAAPCPPAGLRVVSRTVVNDTQILRASWSTVSCPNSEYLLGLKGNIQGNSQALFDLASYWTSRTFFEIPLPCGSSYNATIRARNSAASSGESAAVTGTTVPCAPLNVTFSASSGVVAWHESIFATNYTTYGVTSSGRTKLCMTSQLLCSITNFSSGHIVVRARNAAGESEDSVPILVTTAGRR